MKYSEHLNIGSFETFVTFVDSWYEMISMIQSWGLLRCLSFCGWFFLLFFFLSVRLLSNVMCFNNDTSFWFKKHLLIRMFCRIPAISLGALQKLSGPMPLPTPMAAHMSPGVAAPMSFPCSHLKSLEGWCIFCCKKTWYVVHYPQGATPVGMRWRKLMHDRSKAKSFVPFVDDFVADVN